MALQLVQTVTVGSGGAASIEFTNIPQTGKDLLLLHSLRNSAGAGTYIYLTINGSTLNKTGRTLYKYSGSSVYSGTEADVGFGAAPNTATADTFGNGALYAANYSSSSNKSLSSDWAWENNSSTNEMGISAITWSQTAAITSLKIDCGNTLAQYSTASLYIIS